MADKSPGSSRIPLSIRSSKKQVENSSSPTSVQTIQKIYEEEGDDTIELRKSPNNRSRISKSEYAKLQRKSSASGEHIEKLKENYQNKRPKSEGSLSLGREVNIDKAIQEAESIDIEQTPAKPETSTSLDSPKTQRKVSFTDVLVKPNEPIPKPRKSLEYLKRIDEYERDNPFISDNESVGYENLITTNPKFPKTTSSKIDGKTKEVRVTKVKFNTIQFAEPESRHIIVRQDSVDSINLIQIGLDNFEMDDRKLGRRSSFKGIRNFFTGKTKKKDEEAKAAKKDQNVIVGENYENESFNRESPLRHTVDSSYHKNFQPPKNPAYYKKATNASQAEIENNFSQMHLQRYTEVKKKFSNGVPKSPEDYVSMDSASNYQERESSNISDITKNHDTCSSNTDSENTSGTYENALIAQAEMLQRQQRPQKPLPPPRDYSNRYQSDQSSDRRTDTPPRAQETYQNFELIKPRASIPINSERPLPNPYAHNANEERLPTKTLERNLNTEQSAKFSPAMANTKEVLVNDIYGTVFDAKPKERSSRQGSANGSDFGHKSPTKLRLPANREKVELVPRMKSPIPQSVVSTDKIIATELLKNKKGKEDKANASTHQNLSIEIDYPQDNYYNNSSNVAASPSPRQNRSTEPSPLPQKIPNNIIRTTEMMPTSESTPTTTNVMVDVMVHSTYPRTAQNIPQQISPYYSPIPLQDRRSSLSLSPTKRFSPSPLTKSPSKLEIRQSVEAFCWKEIKKLKDKQDEQLYGYAQEPAGPGRANRSMRGTTERGRRSLSLPREMPKARRNLDMYQQHQQSAPVQHEPIYGITPNGQYFVRNSPQRRTIESMHKSSGQLYSGPTTKPIFNRGSLQQQQQQQQQPMNNPNNDFNKKVSFTSTQTIQQSWPTKNGYVQSPPQRTLNAAIQRMESMEDDVFLPTQSNSRPPSASNKHHQLEHQRRLYEQHLQQQQQEAIYGRLGPQQVPRRLTLEEMHYLKQQQINQEPIYGRRQVAESLYGRTTAPVVFEPQYGYPTDNRRMVLEEQNHHQINQEPIYGVRYGTPVPRTVTDSPARMTRPTLPPPISANYGGYTRQIRVSNKECDIYGQIHEKNQQALRNAQQSGVMYGQLQRNVNAGPMQHKSYNQLIAGGAGQQQNFVRNSRLTASANDMYRNVGPQQHHHQRQNRPNEVTLHEEPIYGGQYQHQTATYYDPASGAPMRPLPPVPSHNNNSETNNSVRMFNRTEASDNERLYHQQMMMQHQQQQQALKNTSSKRTKVKSEEEWNSDSKSGRILTNSDGRGVESDGELRGRIRNNRRDDPRRHTLGGEQYGMMQGGQGGPLSRTMDLEGQPRGYPPPSNAMLFDDDPGIMSEVETSSTGFRRGGKQRSSLPVVRTPSKTLERPLGLVFLQYRNETKRALLPNEITSIDTVKALFVRSFPKQLSMEYLDSPQVKIYIHDSSKDMFYELEDLRPHLREIRDRSVLRLFESADVSGGLPMAGIGIAGGVGHFEDPSYFSEPEFDSEYQHQHIHSKKGGGNKSAPYYIGSTASLPRAGLLRTYSPAISNMPPDRMKSMPSGAPPKPQRVYSNIGSSRSLSLSGDSGRGPSHQHVDPYLRANSNNTLYHIPDGYMSSPERSSRYEDPYYSQYGTRSGSITPVIDEEISDTELIEDQYSLYGMKMPSGPRPAPRTQFATPAAPPYDATRIRVEHMERQLANLTGLVQKALTQPATLQVPTGREPYRDDTYIRSDGKAPKLGKSGCHKSVSFEKSVSFSDEPPDLNSPKQHSPQHTADTKPAKPAIKSSTLPRTSSQERDRLKPAPPPKPASLSPGQYVETSSRHLYRDLQLTPEMYNQLRGLQKKAKDLRSEVRNLRRMSQAQAHSVRETIRDAFIKIRAMLLAGGEQVWQAGMDQERVRLSREEDLYKQEMLRLETDLTDLESTVEELRGNVINRKTRVNMSDVENMALVLSKSSKTVADLKLRFPGLHDSMKSFLGTEMEKVVREEKFLKEEPERLESALRRCKKLTGTLVTLKRLASVQEQRLPGPGGDGRISPATETPPITPVSATSSQQSKAARLGANAQSTSTSSTGSSSNSPPTTIGGGTGSSAHPSGASSGGGDTAAAASAAQQRPENALDALLDELQTFAKPHHQHHPGQILPQLSYLPPEDELGDLVMGAGEQPPMLPVKGIVPGMTNHYNQHGGDLTRKGSVDSQTPSGLPPTQTLTVATAGLRRLHSYPSGSDTDNSPPIQPMQRLHQVDSNRAAGKPPIPERNTDLLQQHNISGKRVPPPPPPRTSSKSPLASPTSPSLPPRSPATQLQHIQNVQNMVGEKHLTQFELATQNLGLAGTLRRGSGGRSSLQSSKDTPPAFSASNRSQTLPRNIGSNAQLQAVEVVDQSATATTPSSGLAAISASNSSSCESVNSQDGSKKRKEELEQRHQELLKKQRALQEQYARLQQLQRGSNTLAVVPPPSGSGASELLLKKTGSESNILQKMGLTMSTMTTGSLNNLPHSSQINEKPLKIQKTSNSVSDNDGGGGGSKQVYETDIL